MRTVRVALAGLGFAAMVYAVAGAARAPAIVPGRHLAFLLAVLALHDAVWMPLVLAMGALIRVTVPGRVRAHVQGALIVTVSVAAVAWPLVLGRGRIADNPSALPRDYPAGLATTIAATWLAAAVIFAATRVIGPRLVRTRGPALLPPSERRPEGHRTDDTREDAGARSGSRPRRTRSR